MLCPISYQCASIVVGLLESSLFFEGKKLEENQHLTIEDNEENILRQDYSDDADFEDNLEIDDFDSDDRDLDHDFVPSVFVDKEDEDAIVFNEIRKIEEIKAKHTAKKRKTSKSDISFSKRATLVAGSSKEGSEIVSLDSPVVLGKDGTSWETESFLNTGKTKEINIIHIRYGPNPSTNYSFDMLDCFGLFFSTEILKLVVFHTNQEIKRQKLIYKNSKNFSLNETKRLFREKRCNDLYKVCMSRTRFNFLTNCPRFDDKDTGEQRNSKLAPIEEIWNILVENCKKRYKSGRYLTVDEHPVGFRENVHPFKT
ncbi:unnamed protein product [Hermetia illucens]|uniref:PiggyBac transposable element-derived protein domain-containing protein n=1 Tax=Hermetia illucens TaxID=343691 RepID=A0A7R8ULZ1_HERIL|nr:unnamed protein product [Hermetia illucens]